MAAQEPWGAVRMDSQHLVPPERILAPLAALITVVRPGATLSGDAQVLVDFMVAALVDSTGAVDFMEAVAADK